MKKLLIAIVFFVTGLSFNTEANTPRHDVQFGFFYSSLSPYGTWVEIDYGMVVWRPTIIQRGWIPYRQGRWIWTDDGWYWDSYEPFGYITYHYGRWYYDDYYGWIWVPDYDWAPAWVEWRYDDYYIGWAPLPPYAEFSISIGINYTHDYYVPYNHWHFVKYNHFCDPYVYNYYVAPKYKYRIHSRTKYRTNYDYHDGRVVNRGVDIDYVRKRTGQDIREREVVRISDPKEFERYRNKDNSRGNNDVVRTFVASREQISKDEGRNIKIDKSERKTSLETSKIRLGDRGTNDRNDEIKISKDKEKNINRNDKKIEIRKENKIETSREKNKIDNRTNIEKKTTENERNKDVRIKKDEIKIRKDESAIKDKRNESFKVEKKKDAEIKRNPINKDVERKTELNKNFDSNRKEKPNSNNDVLKSQNPKREIKRETNRDFNPPKNNIERKQEIKREVKRETVRENKVLRNNNEPRNDNRKSENKSSDNKRRK